MTERLRGSDYRFIAVCLGLLAASTWFSVRYFYLAFPEASIDFQVGRAEAHVLAEQFLSSHGDMVAGYRSAARFTFDDEAKTFLEREAGLERANQLMSSRVRIWRWAYRWFRPQQKEEYRVEITPRGELAGFEHQIPEDARRPALSDDQARAAAEQFLRDGLHRDPATLDFVEVSTVTRPARADRVYTWKERDFTLHDATLRREVTLLGNEVGGYREYLKIPEQWTRDYERLRSKNEVAQLIDTALVLLLAIGMIVVIVQRVRGHDVRWRWAAQVGLLGMVLSLCASANEFPLQEFSYPSTDSYGSFLARQVLQAGATALAAGGLLFLLAAAAEPLYREFFPGKLSLGNLFRGRGLRTRGFLLGSILGLSLCGIFIAYQTAFYIVAYRFGAWSPADVPYTDLLNTRFPWLYVLFGGFLPAVSEEFLFRMFAIPFLRKLVRYLPAAVVMAGFVWGFGHAGYPQQPFYIRGVEVGIGGIALGMIMLRWGILPTLVWHYSVDAMYGAMLLLRSQSLYFRLSGAASAGVMVLPVVVALIAYWRRGAFEPEAGLTNAHDISEGEPPPPAAPEPPETAISYRPLTARVRILAFAVCAAGLLTWLAPVSRFGTSPKYQIGTVPARSAADAFVRAQGMDPNTFREVTFPAVHWGGDDSLAGKYLFERSSMKNAATLFERFRPVQYWVTRYFRSLDQEEMLVTVHPESGKVLGFVHTIPEDRPGADVAPDAAREAAARFASSQGLDVDAMELKESTSEKKKARRDHKLVWEARAGDPRNLDEAKYRVEIEVDGDRVSSLRSYWKIPEAYARARSQQNALSNTLLALRLAVISLAAVYGIWLLIQNIRHGLVRWQSVMRVAAPAALLTAAGPLLSLPLLLKDYNTAIPLGTYEAVTYTSVGMSVALAFLVLGAAVALVTSCYPESLLALRASSRRSLGLDSAVAVLAAAGVAVFLSQAGAWLTARFPAQALISIATPSLVASAAPAVAAFAGAVRTTLFYSAALALVTLLAKRLPQRWMLLPLGLVAPTVILPSGIHTAGEFTLGYGIALLLTGGALLFGFAFARANYLAWALTLWILALSPAVAELFSSANPSLEAHALAIVAVMVLSLLCAVAPAWRSRPTSR